MPETLPAVAAQPPPDLHRLENLQALVIENGGAVPASVELLNVLAALRGTPGCVALETIDLLSATEQALFRSEQCQWRAADAALADAELFPSLQRVRVRMRMRSSKHPDFPADYAVPLPLATQLHKAMALCHQRRIFFVN